MGNPLTRLTTLAAAQAGAFSIAQCNDCGVTRAERRTNVALGRWLWKHHGVFTIAGSPNSPEQRLWAARLALGEHAAISHRSALWVWRIAENAVLEMVEFTVPKTLSARHAGIVVHRPDLLRRREVAWWNGLPVTNVTRTLLDIGAVLKLAEVENAFDAAISRRLVTPPEVLAALNAEARRGRSGCAALRAVLLEQGVGSDRSPSYLEAKALRLFRRHRLPEPRVELTWGDHGQFRLDFIWLEFGLVVEVDGWDCHASHKARTHDLHRRNKIVLGHLRPLTYTYGDIRRDGARVVQEIREAIAATSISVR